MIRRGHADAVAVHWSAEDLWAFRTGETSLDFEHRLQLLTSLTTCPGCWQCAQRGRQSEAWPATSDVVVRALRSASAPMILGKRAFGARKQRALNRPMAFFHLALEELRGHAAEPSQDGSALCRTVMYLDLFLAGFDEGKVEGLRDAEIHLHLISAEFWASRGQLERAKEELDDADFGWRHGGRDPLLQAEIVLLRAWIERLESQSIPERNPHVRLDR